MNSNLLRWQVFEITSKESSLNGIMLRGRIRKFGIENGINVLAENTEDLDNAVRFSVLNNEDAEKIKTYLKTIVDDMVAESKLVDTPNPVLSKLKVNIESRYNL